MQPHSGLLFFYPNFILPSIILSHQFHIRGSPIHGRDFASQAHIAIFYPPSRIYDRDLVMEMQCEELWERKLFLERFLIIDMMSLDKSYMCCGMIELDEGENLFFARERKNKDAVLEFVKPDRLEV